MGLKLDSESGLTLWTNKLTLIQFQPVTPILHLKTHPNSEQKSRVFSNSKLSLKSTLAQKNWELGTKHKPDHNYLNLQDQ